MKRILLALMLVCMPSAYAQTVNITGGEIAALTDAPQITWDASGGFHYSVILGGDRFIQAPSGLIEGATYTLTVKQDTVGARFLTYDETGYLFPWTPMLASVAGSTSVLQFYSNGTKLILTSITTTPVQVPNAPSTLTATDGVGQIALSWTDNSAVETAYRVIRFDGMFWGAIGDVAANATSYVDVVEPGVYEYRIIAITSAAFSNPSNTVSGTSSAP